MDTSDDLFYQKTTSLTRDDDASPRQHAPWKMAVTTPLGEHSASSAVEWMTQGELITLWQQIGAAFNLAGMRDGMTDDELEKLGVHSRK